MTLAEENEALKQALQQALKEIAFYRAFLGWPEAEPQAEQA